MNLPRSTSSSYFAGLLREIFTNFCSVDSAPLVFPKIPRGRRFFFLISPSMLSQRVSVTRYSFLSLSLPPRSFHYSLASSLSSSFAIIRRLASISGLPRRPIRLALVSSRIYFSSAIPLPSFARSFLASLFLSSPERSPTISPSDLLSLYAPVEDPDER